MIEMRQCKSNCDGEHPVLIVGGGLAGLNCGLCLERAPTVPVYKWKGSNFMQVPAGWYVVADASELQRERPTEASPKIYPSVSRCRLQEDS